MRPPQASGVKYATAPCAFYFDEPFDEAQDKAQYKNHRRKHAG
jgi:hypothetical protein